MMHLELIDSFPRRTAGTATAVAYLGSKDVRADDRLCMNLHK